MDTNKKPFATGSCLCGAVKYTINAQPLRAAQCHCDDCRKSTGTGHASNAFFNKDDVIIEGTTNSFAATNDAGSKNIRHFCPNCGSRLFGTNNVNTQIISVSAGTLDDSSWFKPNAIVYHKRKPVWDVMDDSVPTFDEMPKI